MKGGCLCGRVAIDVPGRPDHLNACNCSLCWSLGALWGYFPRDEVSVTGERSGYRRTDMAATSITADFCPHCGATTNWTPLRDDIAHVGINMRLFDPAELTGIEVRYEDVRHATPDGEPTYYAPSTRFDGLGIRI